MSRVSWLVFVLRIWKVSVSNLGLETTFLNSVIAVYHDSAETSYRFDDVGSKDLWNVVLSVCK